MEKAPMENGSADANLLSLIPRCMTVAAGDGCDAAGRHPEGL
ncbi:hypothetical protein J2848_002434 [Azospirillum lipoferum]|nr:hypothetical protein [Azospirillum sp. NL1]MCP1610767.1 hypothetical protein [Azospirillum lipoferum]